MRFATTVVVFAALSSTGFGQAYKVTPEGLKPSPDTPTYPVVSPGAAASAAAADADANVARQIAIDAANRAVRRQNRNAAEAAKRNVVLLPEDLARKWKERGDGAQYFRDGRYEAQVTNLGYRVRVIKGPKQFVTLFFPNLDAAIDEAVRWTGGTRPNIPGSQSYASSVVAKALPEEKQTSYTELAWAYAGESAKGESWKDSTAHYTIVCDPKSDDFDVAVDGKTVAEKLATIDDAIEAAERHASERGTRSK